MAKKQPTDKLQRMMNIANRNKVEQSNQPDKKEEPKESPADKKQETKPEQSAPKKSKPQSKDKIFSSMDDMLNKLKEEKKPESKYTQFRMRTTVIDGMKEIADKEGISSHGKLIHEILQNFISAYESQKGK
ncbi:hypothetical protein WJR50_32970 [Catalinimonas sp. 4WD22]|uniref:hypothetical protein n=1 Tax=Catalinimonas locisalis TaxID=3133978 RepID=UPI00310148EE